ncbi:AraC family transcriptional regulator [Actinoplanes subglobosus]|uniref:AraC family transcriptional regulator n=1 Tax=Actinoplanes subglobosus TaxID=1547892 RepID=A0ABV8IQJ1_9ACTN
MSGATGGGPVARSDVSTTDIAAAHEFMSSVYVDHLPRLALPGADFVFRSRTVAAGEVAMNRLSYRGAAETVAEPFDAVTTAVLFDGWYSVGTGGAVRRFTAGDALLVPLGVELDVSWAGLDLQTVRLPLSVVARAAQRLGVEPVDFRFDGPAPVSERMNRHWIATVGFVTRAFAGPDPAVTHPLVYAAALDTLAAAAVAAFPNTTMTAGYTPGPGRVPPAVVRRALAYIDAHAAEPITVEDIAEASGIGVRGLQAAFARHGDRTPMQCLRQARMAGAHRELRAGDPSRGDTVAVIARRWGFATPGRFAAGYREIYGRLPGHTLRT